MPRESTVVARRRGAVLQLVNARREHASTVLTSNKGLEEWGGVRADEVMAAALIDRLLHHHCHIVNIRGNSCRASSTNPRPRLAHPRSRPTELPVD